MLLHFFNIVITAILFSCVLAARTRYGSVEYQIFESLVNPNYSVRFVRPKLCDSNVIQYSGYLDMGADNHYFFWFFESKTNSTERPLTAWLNGGPGCSSILGLWQENGPCRSPKNGTQIGYNPYTWTHYSNMLYIDQPNGVGFSYGNTLISHVKDGAVLFYKAMQLFFEAFPKYSQTRFHIFGESYAGRYIPHYADYIAKQNLLVNATYIQNATTTPTSLKLIPIDSVGIGNGWINPLLQFKNAARMACGSSYGPLVTRKVCEKMKTNYLFCASLVENCYKVDGRLACLAADRYCAENVDGLFETSGRNYYDVRKGLYEVDPPEDYIKILNLPDVQKAIGVQPMLFEQCAEKPYEAMSSMGEGARDSSPALVSVLNSGIRVLIYSGDADYLCNWYGNYELTSALQFNGSDVYSNATLGPWFFQGKEVGQIKSTNKLTFLRVYNAGHEVPYYQPRNALAMFYKWINERTFSNE